METYITNAFLEICNEIIIISNIHFILFNINNYQCLMYIFIENINIISIPRRHFWFCRSIISNTTHILFDCDITELRLISICLIVLATWWVVTWCAGSAYPSGAFVFNPDLLLEFILLSLEFSRLCFIDCYLSLSWFFLPEQCHFVCEFNIPFVSSASLILYIILMNNAFSIN